MSVIHLPPYRLAATPLFVMIDLQLEYLTDGRPHYLSGAHETFKNCARLLDKLREFRLPIAHFRQVQVGYNFNRASRFSQWAELFARAPANTCTKEVYLPVSAAPISHASCARLSIRKLSSVE